MTVRSFIRLAIDRELNQEEVEAFYQLVDEIAEVEDTSAFEDDGTEVDDVVVTMYQVDETFMYEVAVTDAVDLESSREIVENLMEVIDDDFELDVEEV
jgi:hypothetical protein